MAFWVEVGLGIGIWLSDIFCVWMAMFTLEMNMRGDSYIFIWLATRGALAQFILLYRWKWAMPCRSQIHVSKITE